MVLESQQVPRPPRKREPARLVQVSRVQQITPQVVRVTITGETLAGFSTHGPAEHVKVFYPRPGQDRPVLPVFGPDGRPQFEEGAERPIARSYTPLFWRPESLELDFDVVMHGEGAGSIWARNAKPGDMIGVGGASSPYEVDASASWFVIGGDASAVPAIGTILRELPAGARADVYLEVEDEAEHQELTSPASLNVTWLHTGADNPPCGTLLLEALREADLPFSEGRLFLACESGVMRAIRKMLLFERGMDRGSIHTQGYWKAGATNHGDHDLAEEI
jgi:NADPH-dependent ferric siderophore reductase